MATPKKRVRRIKAAHSPEPCNPTCGHSGCGKTCNVRYCGPTSPMHNHHIVNASRGVAHVWSAAIVAGLAVVLTGAIAYTAVQADTQDPTTLMLLSLRRIEMRLDRMEPQLQRLVSQLNSNQENSGMPAPTSTTMGDKGQKGTKPKPTEGAATNTAPLPENQPQ